MNPEILIKLFLVLISALAGALVLFFIKLDHKKLCSLISLSAGALFSAAVFTLIPESSGFISITELLLSVLSGYFLFFFISKYFAHVCPACSASHFDERTTKKFSEIILTLLVALSIHSFLDGVAITTGSAGHQHNDSVFLAIAVHKFPEGLALSALMFSSGYRRAKIFIYVFLVEFVTVIGGLIGIYLFESGISPVWMGIIMSHISGGFIYLALHAVLGEMLKNHKNLVVISFASGLLAIFLVNLLFG